MSKKLVKLLKKIESNILSEQQSEVLEEALIKEYGGLSLPLGFGKTLLSIVLALNQISELPDDENKILVVASKNLIGSNWIGELDKFFGNKIRYQVLHQDYLDRNDRISDIRIDDNVNVVLTTDKTIVSGYTEYNIEELSTQEIIKTSIYNTTKVKMYKPP